MCAHEGMQVRGERIVGVWTQLTSMAARRVDDIVVCRDGSMCKCLHKHSAPERRVLARTALARTGQGRILQAAQRHRGEGGLRAGHDRARRAGELHVC